MITCQNVQRIHNLDFNNYLLLPQYSHSFLKGEKSGYATQIKVTTKMQLGSLVDAIRTDGEVDMASPLYPAAKKIASKLKAEFGWAIEKLEKQVSYTGDMILQLNNVTFTLPVKGRPDFVMPKKFIIDLKVTHVKDINAMISFMGYGNQQFGYAKLDGCPVVFLLIYSKPLDEIFLRKIQIGDTNAFWHEKILKFGKVI